MNPLGPDKTFPNGSPGEDNGAERIAWPPTQTGRWLRSLVQHASDFIGVLDADGALRYVSPAVERMLGYTPEEMVGTEVFDYIHPDDFEKALGAFAETLETPGALQAMEFRARCADGSWRPVEVVRTDRLNDPNIEGVVVNVRDITERKQAEEGLRVLQQGYEELVDSVGAIIWRGEAATLRFTFISPQAETILGYPVERWIEEPSFWEDHIHPEDRQWALSFCTSAIAENRSHTFEYRMIASDGRIVWLRDIVHVAVEGGVPTQLFGVMVDITESVRAENLLRESERRHTTLLSNVPALVYRSRNEPDWPLEFASDYALELTGHPPEDLVAKGKPRYGDLIVEEHRQRVWEEVQRALAERRRFKLQYAIRRKDGALRHVEEYAQGIYGEDDRVEAIEGIVYDVTEVVRAQEALRKSEERYRTVVENQTELVCRFLPDKTLTFVNGAYLRYFGGSPEGLIGSDFMQHIPPEDHGEYEEPLTSLDQDNPSRSVEHRVFTPGGEVRWLQWTDRAIFSDEGRLVEYQSVGRDITERKRAEERLKEAEERYRSLVERIPVITYLQEPTSPSRTTYLSPQFEAIFGYPVEEVMADPEHWVKMIHPEDRARVLAEDERTNQTGKPFVMEYRQVTRSGRIVWVRDEATLVRGEEDEPLYWHGVMSDVTERKALEERLEHQAFHDPLTCLPNRYLFMNRLEQALVRTTRRRGGQIGVLFIDLDAFKMVNDSLGHENGDRLLVALAERIRGCLRPEDAIARFGGDEFTVLLEDVEGPDEAVRVAGRIADELRDPFALEGRELFVKTSIGIALGDASTRNPESLLRDADTAMYRAKEEGVNYKVFDEAMHGRVVSRMELESDLRRAIEREEFVVHYQPIVNLQTGGLWGLEALVRWDHPEKGLVSPKEFVPIAEETGLIVPLGRWVLEEACRSAREWQGAHPHAPPLIISVNLSAKQLGSPDLARMVEAAIRESGLEHYCLSLDVTETAYIKVLEGYAAALDRLKAMGVRVSIDDFGTGYSSLSYLKRLPADDLKIDRSFVKGLGEDIEDTAIVRMIIDLAHTVGMEVVAEGVESAEQARLLREMGCDLAQGFHFSKPLPPQRVPAFLTE